MKKKILYLFILIFSVSLFSSAKKIKGYCENASVCCNMVNQNCSDAIKLKMTNEGELSLPSLGLFLFTN
ncbi:MAG TPA: hypothetical protein VK492_05920 [Chitinophagaceae bacterium]|nr:hypothetical protein [Chitinophagaceae bacterium]